MTSYKEVERKVLEKIKPKPEEYKLLHSVYERIKEKVDSYLKAHDIDGEATLQGSVAHDTWLSGDRDLDIFVLLNKRYSVEEIKTRIFKLLIEVAEKIGRYELRYAQHPYVRVYVDGVEADLVPAYRLETPEEIILPVDRTPFHTEYVNSRLNDELRDQVRLLKKFMKSIGVYGAEIKVQGFSGYVVELLIIALGSFRKVLWRFSETPDRKRKPPIFIDTLDGGKRSTDYRKMLLKRYPDSVLFVPDPIDPRRNAAANVSINSLAKFVIASYCYLRKPSINYFFKPSQHVSIDDLADKMDNRCLVMLELNIREKMAPDILWGELKRLADRASKVLENNDFTVIDWNIWSDEEKRALILIELEQCSKNYPRLYRGPEFWFRERVLDYINKHLARDSIGPWIGRDGVLRALGRRKFVDPKSLLEERSWEYMVTPHFRGVKPRVKVLDENLMRDYCSDQGVCEWLIEVVMKRPYWMHECID